MQLFVNESGGPVAITNSLCVNCVRVSRRVNTGENLPAHAGTVLAGTRCYTDGRFDGRERRGNRFSCAPSGCIGSRLLHELANVARQPPTLEVFIQPLD